MITSVIQQASTQLGISVDLLRYLADNPDALADLTREARRATTTPAETTDHHTAALDFTTKLQNAFTKPADGAHQGDDDDSLRGAGQVADPAMRRERIAAAITDTRAVEPPPKDRFRFLPRKVWDGKNTSIRQFLLEQYAGRCQICAATFPKRDGDPYFEVVYLVSHTNAAWIDRPGDVLCLCPTCTAKFLHGEVQATDVLDQVRSWRARTEGGDRAVLQMTLCGHLQTINYTEKHLLDLQTLVTQA